MGEKGEVRPGHIVSLHTDDLDKQPLPSLAQPNKRKEASGDTLME